MQNGRTLLHAAVNSGIECSAASSQNPGQPTGRLFAYVSAAARLGQGIAPQLNTNAHQLVQGLQKHGLATSESVAEGLPPNMVLAYTMILQTNNGEAFKDFPLLIRNDLGVAITAVRQNGLLLQFAGPDCKRNFHIALAAVQQNQNAIEFVGLDIVEAVIYAAKSTKS